MEEKELTNEEIIKALGCCIDSKCDECPYTKKNIDCSGGRQERDCIELINLLKCNTKVDSWKNKFLRQLQENETLKKDYIELDLEARELRTKIDELTEERENMQAIIFCLEEEKRLSNEQLLDEEMENFAEKLAQSPQMQKVMQGLIKSWQKETAERFAEMVEAKARPTYVNIDDNPRRDSFILLSDVYKICKELTGGER